MDEVKAPLGEDRIGLRTGENGTSERIGAAMLGAGSLANIAVMLVHPSHVDQAAVIGPFGFSGIVHAAAILAHVAFLYGAWTLSRYLGLGRATPGLALVFAALAAVAMVNAAVISMFIVPFASAQAMAGVSPSQLAAMHGTIHGGASQVVVHGTALGAAAMQGANVWVAANRGFAQVYVALESLAILLWALAWRGAAMRVAGLVVALAVLAWQLSGRFAPSVHTMPIVTIVEGAWLIAAAIILYRNIDTKESVA